ncbi:MULTISPECIES: hybrid sensor histidine kinase/response regulator [Leptolyngbya]|uniref:hybrid sensor histidine kinase/response regulator n=1 Tax=Leptolyngbya TaxID=47251 RepID=UPI001685CAC4|nr:ATP-binding protein [Leptolyngbya sp. FACHB-1624]MBD1858677.1 response regulator [Leptolyngbya sp. FACHB-1624]
MADDYRKILIVDDSLTDHEIYRRYIQQDFCQTAQIWQAESGAMGLSLCQQALPDVILLDFSLPDMTGLEFLRQLQQHQDQQLVPVIMLTEHGDEEVAAVVLKSGASDCFAKNKTTPERLRRAVDQVIERAELYRQLERSQRRFYTSINNMLECCAIYQSIRDAQGKIVDFVVDDVNAATCAANQMNASEHVGRSLSDFIAEEHYENIFAACCSVVETGRPQRRELVFRNRSCDSAAQAFEVSVAKLEDGFVACWLDISEKKRFGLALQKANEDLEQRFRDRTVELLKVNVQFRQELRERQRVEAEFRVLSEAAPVGIFRTDAQGGCIYVNPRAQAICGYTFEGALGDGWQRSIHPDDFRQVLPRWIESTKAQAEFLEEIRFVHPDHTVHLVRATTAPILSNQGEVIGYVGTIEDVTERDVIERMKREFLSIVSHELKTPLTSMRGALALLSSGRLLDDPETAQEMLEIAKVDTERLVRLVDDLLDLERLEAHQLILTKQWCDTASLMRRSIESLQLLAEESQLTLVCQPLNVEIFVDGDRIVQTLINLLGNAIKFSSEGSEVYLKAELVNGDQWVRFQVRDWGRGIPQDKLDLIFERFQQANATDARQHGGTGLGLAISRDLVQLHGGQIWVESTLGEGSTFYFTVPIR